MTEEQREELEGEHVAAGEPAQIIIDLYAVAGPQGGKQKGTNNATWGLTSQEIRINPNISQHMQNRSKTSKMEAANQHQVNYKTPLGPKRSEAGTTGAFYMLALIGGGASLSAAFTTLHT